MESPTEESANPSIYSNPYCLIYSQLIKVSWEIRRIELKELKRRSAGRVGPEKSFHGAEKHRITWLSHMTMTDFGALVIHFRFQPWNVLKAKLRLG